jgi:hypothetical protein
VRRRPCDRIHHPHFLEFPLLAINLFLDKKALLLRLGFFVLLKAGL